jgi:hypothetical protein
MNFEKFEATIKSKSFRIFLGSVITAIVLVIVFSVGVLIGLEKARFSYTWGANYYKNFANPPPIPNGKDMLDAHGSTGQILSISGSKLVIKSAEGNEKNILVSDTTVIRQGSDTLSVSDLKPGEEIVIIGGPDDSGNVSASFIRVLPNNF